MEIDKKIIVTSLPYQVNKAKLVKTISDLTKEKKIEGISEVRDESDRKEKNKSGNRTKKRRKCTSSIKSII